MYGINVRLSLKCFHCTRNGFKADKSLEEVASEAKTTTKPKSTDKKSRHAKGEGKSVRVAQSAADGGGQRERSSSRNKRSGAGAGDARKKTTSTSSLQEEEQAGAPATLDRTEYEETLADAAAQQSQSPRAAASGRGEQTASGVSGGAGSSLLDDLDAAAGGTGGVEGGLLDIDDFLGSSGASLASAPVSDTNPLLRNVLQASTGSSIECSPEQFAAFRLLAENNDLRMV